MKHSCTVLKLMLQKHKIFRSSHNIHTTAWSNFWRISTHTQNQKACQESRLSCDVVWSSWNTKFIQNNCIQRWFVGNNILIFLGNSSNELDWVNLVYYLEHAQRIHLHTVTGFKPLLHLEQSRFNGVPNSFSACLRGWLKVICHSLIHQNTN